MMLKNYAEHKGRLLVQVIPSSPRLYPLLSDIITLGACLQHSTF